MAAAIPTLTTDRLVLREFRDEDVDAFADIWGDEEVGRWLGGAKDRADSWRYMAMLVGHWELRGFGRWAVEVRAAGEAVGTVGLWYPDGWPGIELGWTLARSAWGNGYATEAAEASLDWSWRELPDLERVISLIVPANERSQAVARRLGMHPTDETFELPGARMTVWEIVRPE